MSSVSDDHHGSPPGDFREYFWNEVESGSHHHLGLFFAPNRGILEFPMHHQQYVEEMIRIIVAINIIGGTWLGYSSTFLPSSILTRSNR